jgi:hypothetical protein
VIHAPTPLTTSNQSTQTPTLSGLPEKRRSGHFHNHRDGIIPATSRWVTAMILTSARFETRPPIGRSVDLLAESEAAAMDQKPARLR